MARKKKGKIIQMLSPEKYIKQKARSLPIFECWINTGWEENGLAHISISRKHTNGNVTAGLYLVDLKCLGVKDAFFVFNVSETEYRNLLEKTSENFDLEQVGYVLTHNIIFAGIEFADDYGFKPTKDFSVAKYILEEDTDDIELMEIHCGGDDGKPLYVRGELEDDVRAAQIIAQLEKTAGKDNFNFINAPDGLNEDWGNNGKDCESFDERLEIFAQALSNLDALNDDEKDELFDLVETLIFDQIDVEKTDELFEAFLEIVEKFEITEDFTDEILFGSYTPGFDTTELKANFENLYDLAYSDTPEAERQIKQLQKKYPHNPAVYFLHLNLLRGEDLKEHNSKLVPYYKEFPEHHLLKILYQISLIETESPDKITFEFEKALEVFFGERKRIHRFEIFHLLMFLLFRAMYYSNINEVDVIDTLIENFDFTQSEEEILTAFVDSAKVRYLTALIENE